MWTISPAGGGQEEAEGVGGGSARAAVWREGAPQQNGGGDRREGRAAKQLTHRCGSVRRAKGKGGEVCRIRGEVQSRLCGCECVGDAREEAQLSGRLGASAWAWVSSQLRKRRAKPLEPPRRLDVHQGAPAVMLYCLHPAFAPPQQQLATMCTPSHTVHVDAPTGAAVPRMGWGHRWWPCEVVAMRGPAGAEG